MIRHTLKMLLVALLASFALSSEAEAAAKKPVHPRAKHSSRVTSGSTGTTTVKKPSEKKKRAASSAKKPAARTATKRKPSTKPR